MKKPTIKQHCSCVRVLEFLKILVSEDLNLKDIYEKNQSNFQEIETIETFLKYITTLEFSGLKFRKIDKKYTLCSFPKEILLNNKEIELLSKLLNTFNQTCIENQRNSFNELLSGILKSLPDNQKKKLKENLEKQQQHNEMLSKNSNNFQKYVDLSQKLKIEIDNERFTVEPKSVEIEDEHIYFNVYNPQKATIMKLLTDSITNIEILPLKNASTNLSETIVFEVYERLATNYRLRDCEYIANFSEDKKVIINCGEDQNLLIRRLLKYGENCKIISPKPFQEKFLQTVADISNKLEKVSK